MTIADNEMCFVELGNKTKTEDDPSSGDMHDPGSASCRDC